MGRLHGQDAIMILKTQDGEEIRCNILSWSLDYTSRPIELVVQEAPEEKTDG